MSIEIKFNKIKYLIKAFHAFPHACPHFVCKMPELSTSAPVCLVTALCLPCAYPFMAGLANLSEVVAAVCPGPAADQLKAGVFCGEMHFSAMKQGTEKRARGGRKTAKAPLFQQAVVANVCATAVREVCAD
ncbi:hypothetical protein V8J88_03595 [Massilia sp. W12]|uniref:hypothetical protein n=1 Tax=Massilia sp. W12 TaxID=3126507 RepID=UPI0030D46727